MTAQPQHYKEATIILIDDDDVDALGVERALKKLKILNPIVRARDGIEGLSVLRKQHISLLPYVVLLDINMPRMNGLEMLAKLRDDPDLSSSVVFVLTTSKTEEDKVAAYRQHVAGYIVKSQIGDCFLRVVEMLDHYWRVVELPCEH